MARRNANSWPGVWLGLLLVLVAQCLAQSTLLEKVSKPDEAPKDDGNQRHDSTILRQVYSPVEWPKPEAVSADPKNESITTKHDEENGHLEKQTKEQHVLTTTVNVTSDVSTDISENGNLDTKNVDVTATTVKSVPDHYTLPENQAIPTIATIDFEKHLTTNHDFGRIEKTEPVKGSESDNDVQKTTTDHQEFEFNEEHVDFEEHTNSEFAEGTTLPTKSRDVDSHKISENQHKNTEHFDFADTEGHRVGGGKTISLINDTNVNYHKHVENNGATTNNISGTDSPYEPNYDVEVFKNVTHPAILRISEITEVGTVTDNTTPYSSSSQPKGRTISATGDDDLSPKKQSVFNHTGVEHTTSEAIMRIFPKKSTPTEKPAELKPYPYLKSETRITDHEQSTESPSKVEESTEEISPYENTIGRKKSDEKLIVTEPSVLVENSIQQFKPIHYKRSGNSTRFNSTFDASAATSTWALSTIEDLANKNATQATQEFITTAPDTETSGQINNDVPQDKPNEPVTTERSPVILSEVTENNIEIGIGRTNGSSTNFTASTPISKKLIEHAEVTAEDVAEGTSWLTGSQVSNSTDKIETVSNRSSTSNEIQTEIEDSKMTLNQFNVTEESTEYPVSRESGSVPTEVNMASASNATDKLSSEVESTVSLPISMPTTTEASQELSSQLPTSLFTGTDSIEKNLANATEDQISSQIHDSTRSIAESTSSQTTTLEIEFFGLTEPDRNSTASQSYDASSEKANTVTNSLNETARTTEAPATTETLITEVSTDQIETTSEEIVETSKSDNEASSTTVGHDSTTTTNDNSDATTNTDLSNTTSSPISESIFTTAADVYTDSSGSSTTVASKGPSGRIDSMTTEESTDSEETTIITEIVQTTDEATTVSNIEVIVSSESTSTQSTTSQTQSSSDLPEFPVSSDGVTLFVRIIVEGSWNEVCPTLGSLRSSLAKLLTDGTDRSVLPRNIILYQTQCSLEKTVNTLTPVVLYVVDDNGDFDYTMTEIIPTLHKQSPIAFPLTIHSVEKFIRETETNNNAVAVVAVSSVAFICLVLLAGLLFIMRKRQTRFNYGERCRPVSLDAYSLDSVSAYNSVRRKGLVRASKRSYGNPAFEDSSVTPTHPLNFAGLSSFCNDSSAITEEFAGIPQVSARIDELPAGAEVKNRYANVVPLPETRVPLQKINNEPLTEYINASYVRGPKNATKYYIACQAPLESTVSDFWRMIWEQQSKVIIMLTDIIENGVEKCVDYIPPSEVTDCHRLYGDYQVTLKKREAKEKYAISTLHLKNLENNTYREVSHIWYLWPTNGVPSDATGLIAILLEARALQRGAPGPVVVHCSPGTGRTGTLIALDLGIRQYEITRTVDVPRVVYTIRRDRAGAVQTKEQYAFIYKALNLYAAKLAGGALESM